MRPDLLAMACEAIVRRREPVMIYLVRTPGSDEPWPTASIPVGRAKWVGVGSFDRDIKLGELEANLDHAAELMRNGEH